MTGSEIMAAVGFFILVSGALWGVWWRVEGKVKVASDRADSAHDKISDLRLHVAQEYTTKTGLHEVKDEIMDAIHGVKSAVDHMGERIDGIYHTATPRPRKAQV